MSSFSNQRGAYGTQHAAPASQPQLGQMRPETKRTLVSHVILGIGLVVGAAGWPLYKKNNPLGVIALSASGSLVSVGILGLLLGSAPGTGLKFDLNGRRM